MRREEGYGQMTCSLCTQETPDPPYDRGGWLANLVADPCSDWTYSFGECGTWPMARPDDEGSGRAKKTNWAKPKNQKALVQQTVTPESREQVVQIFLIKWFPANNRLNLRLISPNIFGLYEKRAVSVNRSSRFDRNRFAYGQV